MSGLLDAGWSGAAADQYRDAWHSWNEGADEVLAALGEIAAALGQARSEIVTSDELAADSVAPLTARLQERLS